jgi:glutaredoxin
MAKPSSSALMLIGFGVAVFGALIAFAVFHQVAPSPNDALAQCLTDKGVKMYGAWFCPHCAAQKEAFGTAFHNVTYVECAAPDKSELQVCKDAGITGYPTWVFADGKRLNGEQPLATLAEKAGCDAPSTSGETASPSAATPAKQ